MYYSFDEQVDISLNNSLNNFAIDSGNIDSKVSSQDEEDSKKCEVKDFDGLPAGDNNLQ